MGGNRWPESERLAREYAQTHVGGMQPVQTEGERIRAAYLAGYEAGRGEGYLDGYSDALDAEAYSSTGWGDD